MAGLGQTGRGPESPIRVVQNREKGPAPARSGVPATGTVRLKWVPGCLCVPPGRRLRGPTGGGAARDTWPRPRAASGRRGGEGRGGAALGLAAEAPGDPERGSCGPAPAPAR